MRALDFDEITEEAGTYFSLCSHDGLRCYALVPSGKRWDVTASDGLLTRPDEVRGFRVLATHVRLPEALTHLTQWEFRHGWRRQWTGTASGRKTPR